MEVEIGACVSRLASILKPEYAEALQAIDVNRIAFKSFRRAARALTEQCGGAGFAPGRRSRNASWNHAERARNTAVATARARYAPSDVRLIQNAITPGNGDEAGFALTIATSATISQWPLASAHGKTDYHPCGTVDGDFHELTEPAALTGAAKRHDPYLFALTDGGNRLRARGLERHVLSRDFDGTLSRDLLGSPDCRRNRDRGSRPRRRIHTRRHDTERDRDGQNSLMNAGETTFGTHDLITTTGEGRRPLRLPITNHIGDLWLSRFHPDNEGRHAATVAERTHVRLGSPVVR